MPEETRPERITVIGLGRFGTSLARTLHELGYEVTAIDITERQVADAAEYVSLAAQGDGTDEELLRSLHVERSDVAVVAQGENLEASVLTTLILKRLAVPWVIAKARTELHGEILRRIGADQVVYPEREAGIRVAHSMALRHINDYITLTPSSGIAKVSAPEHFFGRTIDEIGTFGFKGLNLLLIQRGRRLHVVPHGSERIEMGDQLIVVGPDVEITRFFDPQRARPDRAEPEPR
jgi:trk system potassium uptake protein TrkA